MPEKRLADARKTLPEGYQFGDAHAHDYKCHMWARDHASYRIRTLYRCATCGDLQELKADAKFELVPADAREWGIDAPVPDLDHRWGGDPTVRNFIE